MFFGGAAGSETATAIGIGSAAGEAKRAKPMTLCRSALRSGRMSDSGPAIRVVDDTTESSSDGSRDGHDERPRSPGALWRRVDAERSTRTRDRPLAPHLEACRAASATKESEAVPLGAANDLAP
jgi:hypothetical protein